MITSTMNKEEVNREIIRVLPRLMKIIISKTKHRERLARKRKYPDELSSYEIDGLAKFNRYHVGRLYHAVRSMRRV